MSDHVFDMAAWSKLSVFEQMGNIGSEVGRAIAAKHQAKEDRMRTAFYRGLDLIDYTAQLWASEKSPRLRELLIARELFAETVTTDKEDSTLEKYFMEFAIAAKIQHDRSNNAKMKL